MMCGCQCKIELRTPTTGSKYFNPNKVMKTTANRGLGYSMKKHKIKKELCEAGGILIVFYLSKLYVAEV